MRMRQLCLTLLMIICTGHWLQSSENNVVAYVNNTILTQRDLDAALKQGQWGQINRDLEVKFQGKELNRRRENLRRKVLESMVTDKLMNDAAKKLIPMIPKSMVKKFHLKS